MRFAIPLLVVVVLILTACSATPTPSEVVITSTADGFSPATVEVDAGQPVRLTLNNMGSTEHQLAIKELPIVSSGGATNGTNNMPGMSGSMSNLADMNLYQVHMVAQAGQRMSMDLTPSKPGQYEFFCIEPGHTERGILIVK